MSDQDAQPKGLVAWFAHNHVAANIIMLFLIIGGIFAVLNMRSETFPSIDPKMITVTVPFPGSTPFEVEDAITSRVEEAVMGIDGVKRVTSTAQEGAGVVQIELEDFANPNDVRNDVETEIDRLADFPPEDAEDPVIVKLKPTPPVITLALYGDVPEKTLKYWGEKISEDMIREAGVSLVDLSGDRDYEISIEVPEFQLRKHQLSLDEVAQAVQRFSVDLPAGTLETESGDILLRVQEKGETGKTFEDIVIRSNPDGSLLRLRDIAIIKDGFEDQELLNTYNGQRAILIDIKRSEAQDTLKVEKAVQAYLKELELPAGMNIAIWESRTDVLKDRINLLARNAILGYALVFLVLLLFLDLKLAFWTSMGIPISFLGGLMIVYFMGLSINMITLFALIVVLGIVVDDAIVTGESIFNRQQKGDTNLDASVRGVKDVMAPVTIGVLTSVAAFAPLLYVTGTLGQILQHIPVVVISILLISLVEAFLILPAHLSSSKRWSVGILADIRDKFSDFLEKFTDNILLPLVRLALKLRYASLAAFVAVLIIVAGVIQGGLIRFVFFPQIEGDEVTISLTMPVGTPFDVTKEDALDILEAAEDVESEIGDDIYKGIMLTVGSTSQEAGPGTAGGGSSGNHLAQLRILLVGSDERSVSAKEVEQKIREKVGDIPGAEELSFESGLVRAGADLNIQLAHSNADILEEAADRLKNEMQNIDGVIEVADSLKPGKREYVFELKPAGLAAGLTPAEVGRQLRNTFYGYEVQRIQRGRTELKVMVRYPEDARNSLNALYDMRIRLPGGEEAPLKAMVDIREQTGYATIERANRKRIASITADVNAAQITPGEANAAVFANIIPKLQEDYPDLSVSVEGEARDRQEDLQALGNNMLIAMMLIFVLLGALLQSYIQPLVIMAVIPFGIIGAAIGHLLLGYNLSFISFFGMVALTGVIVNDSVVMIDYFNKRRKEGGDLMEMLIESVQRRFRPILLTTMTTSFGLLPILMETSLQARFLIPMAISLAFGLIFGTLILLFLVPVLVAITEDVKGFVSNTKKKFSGKKSV